MLPSSHCRDSRRHTYRAPVRFVVEGDENIYSGTLADIALSGAFVHSFNCPADGSQLRLRFAVPFQDAPVEVQGEVVRNRPLDERTPITRVGFAVRFLPRRGALPEVPPPGAERRRQPRRACDVSLRFRVEDPLFFTGFAQDLSTGGIFVQTFSLPDVGDTVTVSFTVPGLAERVEALARVVWIRPEAPGRALDDVGFGARFGDLPPDVVQALNRYVSAHDSEFFA